MKIKFYEYGSFTKKFTLNSGSFSMVKDFRDKMITVKGTETLEIKDRLFKKVYIDLKKFDSNIDIHLYSFKVINMGRVVAIVVPSGTEVSIF